MLSHRQTRVAKQADTPVVHWCQICGDRPARTEFDLIYCSSNCARAAINADFERDVQADADYDKRLHRVVSKSTTADLVELPPHDARRDRMHAHTPARPAQES